MGEVGAIELTAYGGFALLCLREILRFVRELLNKRGDGIDSLKDEVHTVNKRITSVGEDTGRMLLELRIAQDRQQRFYADEWPKLASAVERQQRRLAVVETGLAVAQRELGLHSGLTPQHGVPIPIPTE